MKRLALLVMLLVLLGGCARRYSREILISESLDHLRFVRVEFIQTGRMRTGPLSMFCGPYAWDDVAGFALVSEDGWKLVVTDPGPGYPAHACYHSDPMVYRPGRTNYVMLIDPQGRPHPLPLDLPALPPP